MAIPLQFSRFSAATDFLSPEIKLFPCRNVFASVRCAAPSAAGSVAGETVFDTKEFRKNLTRKPNYNRKGFGRKDETLEDIKREYNSDILQTLKANGYEYTWGNVTVKLAESYGFCWGVERAIQITYEAKKQFPEEKIWITNEIIHNPTVNKAMYVCDYILGVSLMDLAQLKRPFWRWGFLYPNQH